MCSNRLLVIYKHVYLEVLVKTGSVFVNYCLFRTTREMDCDHQTKNWWPSKTDKIEKQTDRNHNPFKLIFRFKTLYHNVNSRYIKLIFKYLRCGPIIILQHVIDIHIIIIFRINPITEKMGGVRVHCHIKACELISNNNTGIGRRGDFYTSKSEQNRNRNYSFWLYYRYIYTRRLSHLHRIYIKPP